MSWSAGARPSAVDQQEPRHQEEQHDHIAVAHAEQPAELEEQRDAPLKSAMPGAEIQEKDAKEKTEKAEPGRPSQSQ